jgi:PleD family two-component response regulator
MRIGKPKALLVGEKAVRRSSLQEHLEGKGFECSFASSYDEARSQLSGQAFDLVFSPLRLSGMNLFSLMELLEGSEVTLFYFHAVEQGFWCLPALRQGQRCFGSSGLRPNEFLAHLDELIDSIHRNRRGALEPDEKRLMLAVADAPVLPAGCVPRSAVRGAAPRKKRSAGA